MTLASRPSVRTRSARLALTGKFDFGTYASAFGSETDVQTVMTLLREKMAGMRRDLDLTIEYQRMGALKGLVLDADGTTEIYDMFEVFGLTKTTHSMALGTAGTDVLAKAIGARRKMEA